MAEVEGLYPRGFERFRHRYTTYRAGWPWADALAAGARIDFVSRHDPHAWPNGMSGFRPQTVPTGRGAPIQMSLVFTQNSQIPA